MTPKRIMIIAGETSGDVLAAELVKELRAVMLHTPTYTPDHQPLQADLAPRFFGAGGPRMAEAGVDLAFDMTRHSVTGLSDVLKNYSKFKRLFDQLFALAVSREPHAIICVDFSGFNRRFAAAIKHYVRARQRTFNNWDPKIIQYVSPQVWASRPGRADQMARDVDLLLSIFPFEKDWYATRVPKLRVEFVGHPMIDRYSGTVSTHKEVPSPSLDPSPVPLLLLLPGSRSGELNRHLPPMLGALEIIQASAPGLRARMVLPTESLVAQAKRLGVPSGVGLRCGGLAGSLSDATLAISKTGTVTMECAFFGVPAVTLYKTSWFTYEIGKLIATVESLTMANLLAKEEIFPEFIQDAATPKNISNAALKLLRNPERRDFVKSRLAKIIASLGGSGASRRAAEAIVKMLR